MGASILYNYLFKRNKIYGERHTVIDLILPFMHLQIHRIRLYVVSWRFFLAFMVSLAFKL